MSKGVWPAVSGSIAQSQRLDVVANNLANVNTDGFKRDQAAFRKVMANAEKAAFESDIPRQAYTDKELHPLDGRDTAFVVLDGVFTDFSQGKIKNTGSSLDIAVEGKGFIEVLTPQGPRYTRQGGLKLNSEGALVTTEGFRVLSRVGPDAAATGQPTQEELEARSIIFDAAANGRISITERGEIFQGRDLLGEISLVEFVSPKLLQKEGNSVYRNEIGANLQREVLDTKIRQGMLEASNVNPISELTNMLQATRLFEANQKIVKAYGELEAKAVNDIGRL